jgi:hypothetical protein
LFQLNSIDFIQKLIPLGFLRSDYLPLIYSLALQGKSEEVSFFNDKAVGGSLTMTSVKIGN